MCYDFTLLVYDSLITCETKHCHGVGCYKIGDEWICFDCLNAMDGKEIEREILRVKNNIQKHYYASVLIWLLFL